MAKDTIIIDNVEFSADKKTLVRFPVDSNIKEYIVPEGVTKIGKNAFDRCENLESIILPDGVKRIDEFAFGTCKKLKSIILPDSISKIENCAFFHCESLKVKADDLKKAIPEIDWDKGPSGILIEENIAEKLALFIAESLLSIGEENCNNDNIAVGNGNGGVWTLVCSLLSQLCPATLAELQKTQEPILATERCRVPDYLDEIVYDEEAIKAGKSLKDSLVLLTWEGIIPLDDLEDWEDDEEEE